jgi:hypothetical protein
MSTLCFLKKALRTLFIGILFWNSVVPSLEGMVRSAATFHVSIRRVLDDSMDGGDGNDFFRRGGEMGTFISDMSRTLAKRAGPEFGLSSIARKRLLYLLVSYLAREKSPVFFLFIWTRPRRLSTF